MKRKNMKRVRNGKLKIFFAVTLTDFSVVNDGERETIRPTDTAMK